MAQDHTHSYILYERVAARKSHTNTVRARRHAQQCRHILRSRKFMHIVTSSITDIKDLEQSPEHRALRSIHCSPADAFLAVSTGELVTNDRVSHHSQYDDGAAEAGQADLAGHRLHEKLSINHNIVRKLSDHISKQE